MSNAAKPANASKGSKLSKGSGTSRAGKAKASKTTKASESPTGGVDDVDVDGADTDSAVKAEEVDASQAHDAAVEGEADLPVGVDPAAASDSFSMSGAVPSSEAYPSSAAASSLPTGSASFSGSAGSDVVPSAVAGSGSHPSASTGKIRRTGHLKFDRYELPQVLSNWDIGVIEKLKEFPRGSRKAPKLLIKAGKGTYLLKRRAKGKDDAFKVAFCHELQHYLASKQFPLPHLIGTRTDNNSMLQWGEGTYELFEFIKGIGYDSSLKQTGDSGKTLALFHKLLREFSSEYTPPRGSYHQSRYVSSSLDKVPATLARVTEQGSAFCDEVSQLCGTLHGYYASAVMRVTDMGMESWPKQIVHSDWHPGNMLFRGSRVVAVIDYDAARIQQRVLDIGNGTLQFSILGGGSDPTQWPDHIDEGRFKRFLRGYDEVPGCQLARAELQAIPWLMTEALIAEAAIPIAATGQFARMAGYQFLKMVECKVRWLHANAERLSGLLEEG
jgi:Ser/Thr protein kinase RdoA (MazF antagonist)